MAYAALISPTETKKVGIKRQIRIRRSTVFVFGQPDSSFRVRSIRQEGCQQVDFVRNPIFPVGIPPKARPFSASRCETTNYR